jgi:molecular chaperone DnaK
MKMARKVIGIDLGTTNSVVAVMEGGEPKVIINEEGSRLTPSVVAFTKDGEILVGQTAKRQAITNPENTIFSIKRFVGRRFNEVQEEIKTVPYKVVGDQDGNVRVDVRGKQYTPQEISAFVLQKLRKSAEAYLGQQIDDAVITVPAYFNDSQRQATKDAGRIAGLNVLRIINEPTASALAYGLDKKKDETIAVYDFGGGTFDISILEVGDNVVEVKSTNGDTHLGGDDIDQRVIDWIVSEFKKDQGIDLSKDRMALQRLKEAAERAKVELSTTVETEINLPFITADASGPKHLNMKLRRAELEKLADDLFQRTIEPSRRALGREDPHQQDRRGRPCRRLHQDTQGPGNSEEFFGKEPHGALTPTRSWPLARRSGGVLAGEVKDVLLLDVTPLSLGIGRWAGYSRGSSNGTPPSRRRRAGIHHRRGQPDQRRDPRPSGEREMARDNRTLGRFTSSACRRREGHTPDRGHLRYRRQRHTPVSAKDTATGKEQSIPSPPPRASPKTTSRRWSTIPRPMPRRTQEKQESSSATSSTTSYTRRRKPQREQGQASAEDIRAVEDLLNPAKEASERRFRGIKKRRRT